MANSDRMTSTAGTCEWYTPEPIIYRVHRLFGKKEYNIDLDPASCAEANKVVNAGTFYSIDDNGLSKKWYGKVWLNPPYGKGEIDRWIEKLVNSYDIDEWVCLVNNATETKWGQTLLKNAAITCFPSKRIQFWNPGIEKTKSPTQGQMICASHGVDAYSFKKYFENIGTLVGSDIHI